jgi:hypothetical protein
MMWRRLLTVVPLLVLLLPPQHAAAQGAETATSSATAELLMKKSGLWQQLEAIAPSVKAGFANMVRQTGAPVSAAETERLAQVVDQSYAAPRLRAVAQGVFARELEGRFVASLNRWYDSELGRRITKVEEASAADTTEPAAVMRAGTALLDEMPSPRRALLRGILEATKGAELLTDITINTAIATQQGLLSVAPPAGGGPTPQELRSSVEAQRPQMQENFAGFLMAAMARVYAGTPTPELSQYLDFLRGDAGRHFNAVSGRALDAALTDASVEFGRRLPGTRDSARS